MTAGSARPEGTTSDGRSRDDVALTWHKSSYSNDEGEACIVIAHGPDDAVHVRDSKLAPSARTLTVAAATWSAFVALAVSA
ncbi:DUF397 domain-containing protein [Streptomyces sp. NPDC060194]|uniref:DUF397 domain-containing protein n=1 Tax=Streptomyces sp. NPDC060194 TaxID=3347069 RepID=UPI00364BD057